MKKEHVDNTQWQNNLQTKNSTVSFVISERVLHNFQRVLNTLIVCTFDSMSIYFTKGLFPLNSQIGAHPFS